MEWHALNIEKIMFPIATQLPPKDFEGAFKNNLSNLKSIIKNFV
jgi:hypothetical protein